MVARIQASLARSQGSVPNVRGLHRTNACEDRSVRRSCQVAPKSPRNKTSLELRPSYRFRSIAIISVGHGTTASSQGGKENASILLKC